MTKPEFDPLLSAGFHDIELTDMEKLFVDNFDDNSRRKLLVDQLRLFLGELSKVQAKFEIWLDGSFTTLKDEPDDIDILIVFNSNQLNSLPNDEKKVINSLFNRQASKIRYDLDILLCSDHDANNRSYWRGWFGFSVSEKPKGIARFNYGIN